MASGNDESIRVWDEKEQDEKELEVDPCHIIQVLSDTEIEPIMTSIDSLKAAQPILVLIVLLANMLIALAPLTWIMAAIKYEGKSEAHVLQDNPKFIFWMLGCSFFILAAYLAGVKTLLAKSGEPQKILGAIACPLAILGFIFSLIGQAWHFHDHVISSPDFVARFGFVSKKIAFDLALMFPIFFVCMPSQAPAIAKRLCLAGVMFAMFFYYITGQFVEKALGSCIMSGILGSVFLAWTIAVFFNSGKNLSAVHKAKMGLCVLTSMCAIAMFRLKMKEVDHYRSHLAIDSGKPDHRYLYDHQILESLGFFVLSIAISLLAVFYDTDTTAAMTDQEKELRKL